MERAPRLSTPLPFQIMCQAASGRLALEKLECLSVGVLTVLLWGLGRTQAPVEGCLLGVDEM
jgi:hypothetical protein